MHGGSCSGGLAVVVAEHAAEAITTGYVPIGSANFFARLDEIVAESLMVTFVVIMGFELREARRSDFSPKKIIRLRHSDFMDLMYRSRLAFKFGLWGGSKTAFVSEPSITPRNARKSVSRSTGAYRLSRRNPLQQSVKFLAICCTHAAFGLGVTPAILIRRVDIRMATRM